MGQQDQYSETISSTGGGIRNWVSSVAGHVSEYTKNFSLHSVRKFVRTHPTIFMALGTVMDGIEGDGRCTSQLIERVKQNAQPRVYHVDAGLYERNNSDVYVLGAEQVDRLTNTQKAEVRSAVEDITASVTFDKGNVSHTHTNQELQLSVKMKDTAPLEKAGGLSVMQVEELESPSAVPTSTINNAPAGVISRV